jgi:hypothetical protein
MNKRACVICKSLLESQDPRETCSDACRALLEFQREYCPQDVPDTELSDTRQFHMSSGTWAKVHSDGSVELIKRDRN